MLDALLPIQTVGERDRRGSTFTRDEGNAICVEKEREREQKARRAGHESRLRRWHHLAKLQELVAYLGRVLGCPSAGGPVVLQAPARAWSPGGQWVGRPALDRSSGARHPRAAQAAAPPLPRYA